MRVRNTTLGLVLVGVLLLAVPVGAQENDSLPRYAVVYNTSQGVHVASLLSDQSWRIDTLPDGVFFGQFDVMDCVPIWSTDGHRVYVMVEPEISDPDDGGMVLILSQIAVYDITTQTFEILADVFDAEAIVGENNSFYTGYMIASLSPDERYVWLNSTLSGDSLLVDLQTGKTLYHQPYVVRAVAWSPDAVFVGAEGIMRYGGEYDRFVLSLPEGKRLMTVPPVEGAEVLPVYRAFWLPEINAFVFSVYIDMAAEQQALGMVDAATWTVDYFDAGHDLQAAPSREYVSYVNMAGELIVMDLKRGWQDTLELAGSYTAWHDGDELVSVTLVGAEGAYDATLTNYDYGGVPGLKTYVIAEGIPFVDRVLVSPDIERIMLHFRGDGLALYHGFGGLITDSEISTPDGPAQLKDYDPHMMWGQHYTYFNLWPPAAAYPQSLAINNRGGVVFPPEGYQFVGESPDGRWQLLLGSHEDIGASVTIYHELVAYSERTRETVTLFAHPEDIVYQMAHGRLSEAFVWSPLLDD